MEVEAILVNKVAKVNIDCAADAIEARESCLLLALNVPELIADVLQIEDDASLVQTGSFSAPASCEVTMGTLAHLAGVWTAECLF
jgi:hypothetical protein